MPPKKDKKPAPARTPTLIDGLTKEQMTIEQMYEHDARFREELDREREERNYFQLERDKTYTCWEITDRQLGELKAELKNLDKDIEEDERRCQDEAKVYKQKTKHVLCEHQNLISELKADGVVSAQALQKEQEELERRLHNDQMAIMVDIQELDNEHVIEELELKHGKTVTETRNHLEKQFTEIEAKYEKKMEWMTQEMENRRKYVTSDVEHFWNSHINNLKEGHKTILTDYNSEHDDFRNFSNHTFEGKKIGILKKMDEDKKELDRLTLENNTVCVKEVEEEAAEAENEVKLNRPQEGISGLIWNITEILNQNQLDELEHDHETLRQKISERERDELHKSLPQEFQAVQQEKDLKVAQREREVQDTADRLENMQTQLDSLLSAPNMDHTGLSEIAEKREEEFDSGNTIRFLKTQKL